jgi:hypothetical protein
VVVTSTGSTVGSGVDSRITTLGEGLGDNTGGPGKTFVAAKPYGEGTGLLGKLGNTPRGNARRVGGGSVYQPGAEATALLGNLDLPLLIVLGRESEVEGGGVLGWTSMKTWASSGAVKVDTWVSGSTPGTPVPSLSVD